MSYLPRGQRGTVRTLRLMASFCKRDAASVELRGVAHQIISRIAGHDFSSEIRALFDFVRDQITYRKDQVEVERVQDALRTLQFGNGDCDDRHSAGPVDACLLRSDDASGMATARSDAGGLAARLANTSASQRDF
jgi:hypothetical protein